MFSISCNSSVKSWKSRKKSWKITKPKTYVYKYNWEVINFESNYWKKFEKNNRTIALNVFYAKNENPAYVSKHKSNREKQVIFLMIPNGEGGIILQEKYYQHYQEE